MKTRRTDITGIALWAEYPYLGALLDAVEPRLGQLAADLTRYYQANIPVYDTVDHNSIEANSLAVLRAVIGQLRDPTQASSVDSIATFAREWADQQIPLELVAHSIQLGARSIFVLIREEAEPLGLPADDISAIQDLAWEWATALAAAVYSVQQERAVAGAARRADFLRTLVQGTMPLAVLTTDAPHYRVDPNHPYYVACADWDDSAASSDLLAALRANGSGPGLPVIDAVIDGQLVALLARRPEGTARRAVGIGPPHLPHESPSSYTHARQALAIAVKHGELGYVDLASLGPLPLLDSGSGAGAPLDAKYLGPLRKRGRAGNEILDTVRTYLEHDRKVEETACLLHVHRNTIRYRLTRFTEITGLDIDRTNDLVLAWWLLHRDT